MPRNPRALTAAALLALALPLGALAPASATGDSEPPLSSSRQGGPFVSQDGTQVSGPNTFPRDLVVAPNGLRAYQLDEDRLAVLDVTQRPSPVVARATTVFGSDLAMRRDSRWAYVVNDDRLQVVDVSKQRPRRVREMSAAVPDDALDVAIAPNGKHLYISYGSGFGAPDQGVRVMSLASPAKPRPVARVDVGTLPAGLAVSGDSKRVVTANALVGDATVIDTSRPSKPRVIRKRLDLPFDVEAVAMVGSTAYLWGADDSRLAVVGAGRGTLNRVKNLAPGNDGGGYIAVSGDKRYLVVTHDQQPDDRILTIVERNGLRPVQAFVGTSFPGGLDTADRGPAKGDLFVVAGTGLSSPEGFFPFTRAG
ncbi:hypothetical protein [uncultured Nocardioides sp.]|uniref:YncE family protein n=1 Tax=uncultured Nocardioides sp. TaxID=198441 RepID=UPI002605390A|nr:hypothetical protein [uncultured Nocardioides sp.]